VNISIVTVKNNVSVSIEGVACGHKGPWQIALLKCWFKYNEVALHSFIIKLFGDFITYFSYGTLPEFSARMK